MKDNSSRHLPQDVYHYYLKSLPRLADLAGAEIDMYALPAADALGLSETGRLILSVESAPNLLSVRLGYEYSILENLFNPESRMSMIMASAIFAAYAILAYHDYTIRAKVSQQLLDAIGLRILLAESHIATGQFNPDGFRAC